MQIQDPGELVVVPFVNLVVTLSSPASLLVAGATVVINITISHNSTNSQEARNFIVTLGEYVEEYVLPPTDFTSVIGNQAERTHSKTIFTLIELSLVILNLYSSYSENIATLICITNLTIELCIVFNHFNIASITTL